MRALLLAAALALAPGVAHAQAGTFQGIDAHGFVLVPSDGDLKDYTSTWRAELHKPISFGLEGLFEYANQPLVIVHKRAEDDEERIALLEHVVALNLGGMLALHERVGIGVSVPLYLWTYTNEGRGPAFGDLKLQVPVHLVSVGKVESGRVGFSIVPFGSAPTGPTNRYLGTGSFGGGGLVAFSFEKGPFDLSANVGARYRPRIDYENLTGGPDLLAALGVAYELTDRIALRLEVNSQPNLQAADPERNRVPASEVPAQAILSARGYITPHLGWTAGLGTALTRGAGAAPLRVFAGIHWVVGTEHLLDKDGDGFADKVDQCVNDPETVNGWADDDGCPDQLASVTFEIVDPNGEPIPSVRVVLEGEELGVTNSRGLVTASELMPGPTQSYETKHLKDGYEPSSGTVELTEGEQTRTITMGWKPRPVRAIATDPNGAPVPATLTFVEGPQAQEPVTLGDDGDEAFALVPGGWTLEFTAEGYEKLEQPLELLPGTTEQQVAVTMQPLQVTVTREVIEISETIHFDFDKASIRSESDPLLDEIARVLNENPQITRVGVYGHTSDEGSVEYNQDLSQRRTNSVVDALVKRGIDRNRMESRGFGESKPIVPNDTEANRAKNRRVEFVILEQDTGE